MHVRTYTLTPLAFQKNPDKNRNKRDDDLKLGPPPWTFWPEIQGRFEHWMMLEFQKVSIVALPGRLFFSHLNHPRDLNFGLNFRLLPELGRLCSWATVEPTMDLNFGRLPWIFAWISCQVYFNFGLYFFGFVWISEFDLNSSVWPEFRPEYPALPWTLSPEYLGFSGP